MIPPLSILFIVCVPGWHIHSASSFPMRWVSVQRLVNARLDCNDLVSSMERLSAERSKWIPCHSLLTTQALPSIPPFFTLHLSLPPSFSPQPLRAWLTPTGSCSGLKSPLRHLHGCWRCWSPAEAEGKSAHQEAQVILPLGGKKNKRKVCKNEPLYFKCRNTCSVTSSYGNIL